MNDNPDLDKLDALVGAALKGLVDSGASAAAIGAFAATYRVQAAQVLGIIESPPESPDLTELVSSAVTKALLDLNLVSQKPKKSQKVFVTIAGSRTSVTVSPKTMERLVEERGSKGASQFIRQLADNAPSNIKNRSKWFEERIVASFSFSASEGAGSSQARH